MLSQYRPPVEQWNEAIPVHLIDCPACSTKGMVKVGADPGGAHLWMQCQNELCEVISKLSG